MDSTDRSKIIVAEIIALIAISNDSTNVIISTILKKTKLKELIDLVNLVYDVQYENPYRPSCDCEHCCKITQTVNSLKLDTFIGSDLE